MPGKLIRLQDRSAPQSKITAFGAGARRTSRAIRRGPRPMALPALLSQLERLPALVERLLVQGTPREIRASRISVETLRRMAKEAQLGMEAEPRCDAAREWHD